MNAEIVERSKLSVRTPYDNRLVEQLGGGRLVSYFVGAQHRMPVMA
jgi:hypothetical protein